jgi:hypothetical protein
VGDPRLIAVISRRQMGLVEVGAEARCVSPEFSVRLLDAYPVSNRLDPLLSYLERPLDSAACRCCMPSAVVSLILGWMRD